MALKLVSLIHILRRLGNTTVYLKGFGLERAADMALQWASSYDTVYTAPEQAYKR